MSIARFVEPLSDYIVKIETLEGHGTGFIYFNPSFGFIEILTAYHVIKDADIDGGQITISNNRWLAPISLQKSERIIQKDLKPGGDTAILFIESKIFTNFPQNFQPFQTWGGSLNIGDDVGWAGYPTTHPDTLCFFTGRISAILTEPRNCYLVDGIVINGVSGGPLFLIGTSHRDGLFVFGVVSSLHRFNNPSRANPKWQDVFPGLMQAEGLDQLASLVTEFYRLMGLIE